MRQLPVFVYGTLRSGFGNYNRILKGSTVDEREAETVGLMLSVSGGGFPCLLNKGEDLIKGELMVIDPEQYEETLERLDLLEGFRPDSPESSMYIRESVRVIDKESGIPIEAWVYYWNRPFSGLRHVTSGCWKEYVKELKLRAGLLQFD